MNRFRRAAPWFALSAVFLVLSLCSSAFSFGSQVLGGGFPSNGPGWTLPVPETDAQDSPDWGGDWDTGGSDSGSWDDGGWGDYEDGDTGSDSGSWDSGGGWDDSDTGSDSGSWDWGSDGGGSWDSSGGDSGSWDSGGGSDSGSW